MTRPAAPGRSSLSREAFELEADTIRVLANPTRLMIMTLLGEGAKTVTELSTTLDVTLPNVSQHLRMMRDRRIVRSTRTGRTVRYELTNPTFSKCCALVRQVILEEAGKQERKLRAGHGGHLRATPAPREVLGASVG
jgi:ArsR family transcriptional regulator